eukprot:scaffold1957_cov110-Isochrysis_galbana.AAC.3
MAWPNAYTSSGTPLYPSRPIVPSAIPSTAVVAPYAVSRASMRYTNRAAVAKGSALQSGQVRLGPPSSHVSTHMA